MNTGHLYYVMGPSGAGKDSVLAWVREHGAAYGVVCAHRYITRPAHAGGENHVALSDAEFQSREQRGLFALTWQAHGLRYGIGNEVAHWLARGADVLVNGSRGAFALACERFPALRPVLITASPEAIAQRLAARGRESDEDIAARIARVNAYPVPPGSVVIRNDGNLADAGASLLQAIRS
ncbi:phosphonate metabolism protein/1,5-bisphosphokinase (PRPP-forming) PhnN [Dyella nitratireducens]|uniref:Ribose 1,5-bisphosphate phosphokinase PhnN n=1 Tax=Dyella nitratireducens TaxID=1849580 RepID=A0ABQ1FTF3_9GAMM|nr:phosphonate metabolism protein/1,5-bisphosphokinase (PRPP-forming) PhnN [Dyella nitratireducens]GGA28150.1 ribose 1,5-bisphosphate phosphokinase PhnN [Dyella nitratireducens]GLQ43321.1 ribose 1,5-bisphosphate phosphokinase PhnN [Dyella nitratireducens]